VASTDTGHSFDVPDLTDWAVGHPQKVIDFGYRAHKVVSNLARTIITANMATAPKFAYFYGGSNGGRETMMHAQRYPDDFDGYVSEGPAINWSRLAAAWVNTQQALFTDPTSAIASAKLPAIQAAALAQCDAIDGVTDGVIEDPRACHFNAAVLLCTGAETDTCLTAPQITALQRVMDGPRNPTTGARVYGGYEPGGVNSPAWVTFITGPAIPGFLNTGFNLWLGTAYFSNLAGGAGNTLTYAFQTLNFDTDVTAAQNHIVMGTETLAAVIDAGSTDLSGVKKRNAKIIMASGWDDPVVPSRSIIEYYESVVSGPAFGQSLATTQANFRLFLVPGENHLTGGAGATAYGSIFGQPGVTTDAQHDMVAALEAWVEKGIAPDAVIAAKYVNDDPKAGVARTRPICAYPKLAQYKGTGSTDDAANFSCVDAPRGAYLN
jgi:pimeloyl-ACP methyl ester carboxylesterase